MRLGEDEFELTTIDDGGGVTQKVLVAAGWPWPLAKAAVDNFDYAIGLKNGMTILWSGSVEPSEDLQWATIKPDSSLDVTFMASPESDPESKFSHSKFIFDRGIVVRVSEIVWAADAPHGS